MIRVEREFDGVHVEASVDRDTSAQFKYRVVVERDEENAMWFRRDGGLWRFLPFGPSTTVDMEGAIWNEVIDEWDREGWFPRGAWALLDDLAES